MRDLGNQRVVGVRVGQHGADGEENCFELVNARIRVTFISHTFRYCQSWAPLVSQDIQADAAVRVDVGVVDAGGEVDLRRLEGIVCREVDGQEEDAALEWRVTLDAISI